jgi:hypothetical protein
MLSLHPQIRYLFEPWHLWRVVDSRTDVANILGPTDAQIIMGGDACTADMRRRFRRLFLENASAHKALCVEKTPQNAMRIGLLEKLAPGAKYIHIVRDGVEVASSIARLAETNLYELAFRNNYNQWWGERDSKWNALKRDGAAAGYFPSEVDFLDQHVTRAAYEWLVSLGEIDRQRVALGDRLQELRLVDLEARPEQILLQIANFLGTSSDPKWISRAVRLIKRKRHREVAPLTLPPAMCAAFNAYQERFGFAGRAVPRRLGSDAILAQSASP